jgi:hypothetical protein
MKAKEVLSHGYDETYNYAKLKMWKGISTTTGILWIYSQLAPSRASKCNSDVIIYLTRLELLATYLPTWA